MIHRLPSSFRPQLNAILPLCALLVAATADARRVSGQSPGPALKLLDQIGIDQKLDAQVPLDLKFRDEFGQSVTLARFFGDKAVILNLAYYECPMLCNLTRDGLIKSLRTMTMEPGKEFIVLTVSFDPNEGTHLAAAAKRKAMTFYGRERAADGWHFLTGGNESIESLTKAVGFRYAWDKSAGRFAHASGIVILTPGGRVARYLNGVEFEARDIRLALVEASAGKIGTPTDRVLLFCYQYDPTTGRYGPAIMRSLRAAGAATVLILAFGIGMMIRRERRWLRNRPKSESAPHRPQPDPELFGV